MFNPLSALYGSVMKYRNRLFDDGFFNPYVSKIRVVSVGNLTMGGTGKTPMVDFLITESKKRELKPAIISRGYGRKSKGFLQVHTDSQVSDVGDEPLMLKRKHSDIPIYLSENRILGIKKMQKDEDVDIVIADDAFQHRWLFRDFDILMWNCSQKSKNIFPKGSLRESFDSVQRAHLIVLLGKKEECEEWREDFKGKESVHAQKELGQPYHLKTKNPWEEEPKIISLVSGIAKPLEFEKLIKEKYNVNVSKHLKFKDHIRYNKKIMKDIEKLEGLVITTEKDAVKLNLFKFNKNIFVQPISLKIKIEQRKLDEILFGYHI